MVKSNAAKRLRNISFGAFLAINGVLVAPALALFVLRTIAALQFCVPGPGPCGTFTFGALFSDLLALSWIIPTHTVLLLSVALAATIAGLAARHPIPAALCLLTLPILSLLMPLAAVLSVRYADCNLEAASGTCMLWGADMGSSFRVAADVWPTIFAFIPYTWSLALLLWLIGRLAPQGLDLHWHHKSLHGDQPAAKKKGPRMAMHAHPRSHRGPTTLHARVRQLRT